MSDTAIMEAIAGIMSGMLFLIMVIRLFMMFGKIVANTQHTSESTQEILAEIKEYIGAQNRANTPPAPTGTFEEWKRRQAEGGGAENNERN